MGKISPKEIYSSLLSLVIHAEAVRWNRFNYFLMVNSILLLAWATIYTYKDISLMRSCVLILISFIGLVSGLIWAGLGIRGSTFHYEFVKKISEMEKDNEFWPGELTNYKILTITKNIRDNIDENIKEIEKENNIKHCRMFSFLAKSCHSFFILKWVPIVFSFIYFLLLIPSWLG